ncbi:MAG: cupredoxin domain-containing protein [Thermus sp.]|uniref:cupredoxin domain-containing protein n=1 Tax=Thermus sp. TaxID=275 RepID=UPI003D1461CB
MRFGALLLLLAACAPMPLSAPKAPEAAEVRVSLVDFEFQPKALKVAPGTTLVFVNQGQAPHTVTDSRGRFDSGVLAPGAEFRRTFTEPGSYAIYCALHPYMVFSLEVGP